MKPVYRNLGLAIATLGLIGAFGCGESNETLVTKDTSGGGKTGVAPKDAPKSAMEVYKYQAGIPSATAKAGGYGASQAGGGRRRGR